MKIFNLIIVVVLIGLSSFRNESNNSTHQILTGSFGLCDCGETNENELKIKLTINENFTFSYFDNTNPNKIINLKGNWMLKNETVFLKDYNSNFSIHNKWKMDKNEKCLKSKKGMDFIRLCHLKSCN